MCSLLIITMIHPTLRGSSIINTPEQRLGYQENDKLQNNYLIHLFPIWVHHNVNLIFEVDQLFGTFKDLK